MSSNKQIESGIVTGIFTGTLSAILAAIILQWFDYPASEKTKDKPPVIESKSIQLKFDQISPEPAPPNPAPRGAIPPTQPPRGNTRQEVRPPVEDRDEGGEAERRKRAVQNRAWEREDKEWEQKCRSLRDQLDTQKEEMENLKRTVLDLTRKAESRENLAPIPPIQLVTLQPAPVHLYYRVSSQATKQVEYARIEEIKNLLKSVNLTYVCGRPWKNSGLSPLRVPIAIHKTGSWRSFDARSVARRDQIVSEMTSLGIETISDKPEDGVPDD
ncbi:MAG TPA: hypothetical protein VH592_23665 [Gemmataceae bacterium]